LSRLRAAVDLRDAATGAGLLTTAVGIWQLATGAAALIFVGSMLLALALLPPLLELVRRKGGE